MLGAGTGAVRAEPATREAEARSVVLFPIEGRGWHGRAFAQLGVDEQEGTAAVGAEGRYEGARCDYLKAGGQVRLGVNDSARMAVEQWASACVPVITMEFGHHLEWDVRPSLLAPLGLRPGRNRRETVHFHWQPLRGPLPRVLAAVERGEAKKQGLPSPPVRTPEEEARLPQGDLIIFDIDIRHTILWDAEGALPASWLEQVEAAPFRYINERFQLDIGQGGGEFNDAGSLVHAWLLKLEDLGIGPIDVTGGIGVASGSAGELVDPATYTKEVDVTSPRAVVGLAWRDDVVDASVRASRDVTLVPDGYVTVDSRLDAALSIARPSTRVTVDGSVARTAVHVPGMTRGAEALVGGGALSIARRVTPRITASARFELARSFYAADVLAFDRVPRWGATGFAALEAAVAR